MSYKRLNLRLDVLVDEETADFQLLISSVNINGEYIATIGQWPVSDPDLSQTLHLLFQGYRMGTRYGREGN